MIDATKQQVKHGHAVTGTMTRTMAQRSMKTCSGPWVGLAGYGPWGENHVYCVRLCPKLYPLFLSREIPTFYFLVQLQLDDRCGTNLEPAHSVSMPHSSSLAGSSFYNHIITNPPL